VAYQDRIDETENAKEWAEAVTIKPTETGMRISFSEDALADFQEGTIYFFRPSFSFHCLILSIGTLNLLAIRASDSPRRTR